MSCCLLITFPCRDVMNMFLLIIRGAKWRNFDAKLVVTGRWVTKLEEQPMRWEKVPFPFLTTAQTRSTQRERDRLFGGHCCTFRPRHFIGHISKLCARACQHSRNMLLCHLFERRADAIPQGLGCRQELNGSFVASFPFVDLGKQFK